jgi:two-component system sensor histidine kinase BaeS
MDAHNSGPEAGTRVLIVEDERHIRDLIALHLQVEGLTPVAAGDGNEGLRLAKRDRFSLIVLDLASNAVRHTPAGGRVELSAQGSDREVRIEVRDTGAGIPLEHLPYVFDRFYKVDASRATIGPSGSGLGLSIVRAIVERHGGRIVASNAADGGAIFELTLPVSNAAQLTRLTV